MPSGRRTRFVFLLAALLVPSLSQEAAAQYAFSYQGQLLKSGEAPPGPCLVKFSLWDTQSVGTGTKLAEVPAVLVSLDGGLFTVPAVDFGFDAQDRFLEVAVNCGDPDYTTLSPRELVGSTGGVPAGTVIAFAGRIADIPKGWLLCNGASYPRVGLYSKLYDAILTAHGAPDSSHFFVPDLRGRFLRGVNNGTGRDPDVNSRSQPIGSSNTGGDAVGSLQDDELRQHTHSIPIYLQGGAGDHAINGAAGFKANDSTGAFGGSETRPKNVYVNWIIKY